MTQIAGPVIVFEAMDRRKFVELVFLGAYSGRSSGGSPRTFTFYLRIQGAMVKIVYFSSINLTKRLRHIVRELCLAFGHQWSPLAISIEYCPGRVTV